MSSFLSSPIISLLLHPPTMLLILSLTILVIVFSFLFFSTKNTVGVRPLPPSPRKLPIIGNLHQLSSLPHRSLRSLSDCHGPLMLLRFGRLPVLIASSPSVVRQINQTQDHLFANRPLLKATHELLYHGRDVAFAPYGEYWREMKKATILHLLSNKKVESYKQVRKEEVAYMMEEIERANVSNMAERFHDLTMDVISRAMFGEAARRMWWGEGLRNQMIESSRLMGEFYVGDYVPLLGKIVGVVSGFERRLRKAHEKSDKLFEEIVKERRRGIEKRKEEEDGNGANECFLDDLFTLQEEMKFNGVDFDDESIKAILKDMFGAGAAAPSIPMEWAMAELLRHPTAMKKLKEEITNAVGPNATFVKEEHLSKMTYLKAVVKEVARLHPLFIHNGLAPLSAPLSLL